MPSRFEAGTHNYPGIASLYAGIRFLEERGNQERGAGDDGDDPEPHIRAGIGRLHRH